MSGHSQEQLDAIALQLNMRPRKRFDFKCPIEMMGGGDAKGHGYAARCAHFNSITELHSAPATASPIHHLNQQCSYLVCCFTSSSGYFGFPAKAGCSIFINRLSANERL